jgi:hypothetical protein
MEYLSGRSLTFTLFGEGKCVGVGFCSLGTSKLDLVDGQMVDSEKL